jgi:hypothetical protein
VNPAKLNARKSAKTTKPAKTNSMITQSAKTHAKSLSLMRSNAHTKLKPKGFPSGTPLVFFGCTALGRFLGPTYWGRA